MQVKRIDLYDFVVTFDETEFKWIQLACDKWDESPEDVVYKIVESGFDEGSEV